MTDPLLLTEAEAADRLRLCLRTLRKARQEGRLRFVLIGRAVRYTVADLEAFIDSQRRQGPACPAPSRLPSAQTHRRRQARAGQVVPFSRRNPA